MGLATAKISECAEWLVSASGDPFSQSRRKSRNAVLTSKAGLHETAVPSSSQQHLPTIPRIVRVVDQPLRSLRCPIS
jgi:hypothetical protein